MTQEELNDKMDDMVEAWHNAPEDGISIYDFMGMTREEYGKWVETCIVPQSYLDRRPDLL